MTEHIIMQLSNQHRAEFVNITFTEEEAEDPNIVLAKFQHGKVVLAERMKLKGS